MQALGSRSTTTRSLFDRAVYVAACAALASMIWGRAPVAAAQDLPSLPDPVPVILDKETTAVLVLDMVDAICPGRPSCPPTVRAATDLVNRARAVGVFVVYTTGRAGGNPMPGLEMRPGDPSVAGPADKFFNTELDNILVSHGITTVVLMGVAGNGAPMYTAFEANVRGYTVVVASDVLPAETDFDTFLAQYQILHEPGFTNADNTPLVEGMSTLSRTDLITFR